MKKNLCIRIVILTFILIFFSNIILSNSVYAQDCLRKLGRGISNAALGFLELPMNIQSVGEESGVVAAVSHGILKGLARTVLRTVTGVYETATFIIPVPKNYKPILTNPEFVLGK